MIANALTALRLLLIGPVTAAFARPELMAPALLLALIAIAIASDFLDGAVARWRGTASSAGQVFDHTTDFLFVTISLSGAAWAGLVTPLLPLLIVVAFSQYVLDSRFRHRDKQLRMSVIGRWNGILYFVPLVVLAAARLDWPGGMGYVLQEAGWWLAWPLLAATLVSILDRAMAPVR
ncbi:MAG: CDP-alcohol phosphatidyltransferase family protein [Pseudohongiellaceae bacterium]